MNRLRGNINQCDKANQWGVRQKLHMRTGWNEGPCLWGLNFQKL